MNYLGPLSALAVLSLTLGCSSSPSDGDGSGGSTSSGGASSGGTAAASGGAPSGSGGASATGGSQSGGASSTGGAASGACEIETKACNWGTVLYPDELTLKEEQSNLTYVGHYCSDTGTAVWVTEEACPPTTTCDVSAPACVSCGEDGQKAALRSINGTLTEECEGCECYGWNIQACVADTTEYGEPYVSVVYQHDTDVFMFDMTASGDETHFAAGPATITVSNVNAVVGSGNLIELDVVADYTFTNLLEEQETWHLEGHVVGHCQD